MRILGGILVVVGLLFCLSIVGAVIGLPMIVVGIVLMALGGRRKTIITNVVQVSSGPAVQSYESGPPPRGRAAKGTEYRQEPPYLAPPARYPEGRSVSDRLGAPTGSSPPFQDIENEITQKSIDVLRAARADGYDVQYLPEDNYVIVVRPGDEAMYLTSNTQIRDFGRLRGYLGQ